MCVVCVNLCYAVCVCVLEREREREREGGTSSYARGKENQTSIKHSYNFNPSRRSQEEQHALVRLCLPSTLPPPVEWSATQQIPDDGLFEVFAAYRNEVIYMCVLTMN